MLLAGLFQITLIMASVALANNEYEPRISILRVLVTEGPYVSVMVTTVVSLGI